MEYKMLWNSVRQEEVKTQELENIYCKFKELDQDMILDVYLNYGKDVVKTERTLV